MRAEWQRRMISIVMATTYAGLSRRMEPIYATAGLDPVWITRIAAIAILIICFRLADRIPDPAWPRWRQPIGILQAAYLLLLSLWVFVLLGVFPGDAH
jgi:small-conductance mechanosensitive channel